MSLNSANQLTSYFDPLTSQPYTLNYDKQGNLTSREDHLGTTTFKWNSKNRLTETKLPGGETITYSYSPSGTRVTKSVNGNLTRYSYDGIKIQQEITNGITTSFNYTPYGEPYSVHLSTLTSPRSTSYYYHLYAHGDVVSMTDKSAHEVASYSYSPWGGEESARGPLADSNPIRYAGYYYDSESGMYYLINRYYDPGIGRFISKDKSEQSEIKLLARNQYLYCSNEPVQNFDPAGLDAWTTISDKFPWGESAFSAYSSYARGWLDRNIKRKPPLIFTCSGLALQIIIDYATYSKRRLILYDGTHGRNEKTKYDSNDYNKKSSYVNAVIDNAIQAIDIAKDNTKGVGFGRARVGDLLSYDMSPSETWHTRVIYANLLKKRALTYYQGNLPDKEFKRGYATWKELKYDAGYPLYGKTLSPRRWLGFTPFKGQL